MHRQHGVAHRFSDGLEKCIVHASHSPENSPKEIFTGGRGRSCDCLQSEKNITGTSFFFMHLKISLAMNLFSIFFYHARATPNHGFWTLQQWALPLAGYNYAITYKPGEKHGNADALICLPSSDVPSTCLKHQRVSF